MRDAFGGTFMVQIFLVFILIYICFTALSLNYAKAFKVKNAVIDYLESNEITDLSSLNSSEIDKINEFLQTEILEKLDYNFSANNICNTAGASYILKKDAFNNVVGYCNNLGVEVLVSGRGENTEGVYYTVSTYIGWSMPFLNNLLALNGNNASQDVPIGVWKISGQTRLIVNE